MSSRDLAVDDPTPICSSRWLRLRISTTTRSLRHGETSLLASTLGERDRHARSRLRVGRYGRTLQCHDRRTLAALVEQVARVTEEVPELVELDSNPSIVTPAGALVIDCKAHLAPRHLGPGPMFRTLHP